MRKLDSLLIFCLSAVVFAPFFLEDFPSMAALYGIMTGISACLLYTSDAADE